MQSIIIIGHSSEIVIEIIPQESTVDIETWLTRLKPYGLRQVCGSLLIILVRAYRHICPDKIGISKIFVDFKSFVNICHSGHSVAHLEIEPCPAHISVLKSGELRKQLVHRHHSAVTLSELLLCKCFVEQ